MSHSVFIIAEAGVNHNGSIDLAKKLIDVAVDSGVDAVKFQTFKANKLVVKDASMAEYQKENTGKVESQFEMLKRLELNYSEHQELFDYCNSRGIRFLSTPFDVDSLHMLIREFSLPFIKVSSGDLTNSPFLLEIARLGQKVIISTGMATIEEVREALGVLAFGYLKKEVVNIHNFKKAFSCNEGRAKLKENVTLLHCTTQYPTEMCDVNLNAMKTLREEFDLRTGYSDHTMGIHVAIGAVSLGASVIEKHFTLDREMPGPDHRASLEPIELKEMVSNIRDIEESLGSFVKKATQAELKNKVVARKSIVASREIKKGDFFSKDNLTFKRPEGGMKPIEFWSCLGEKANRSFKENDMVEL
ncbi:N-acetylneuraminate synthase [Halobacteriovorax marinus]|uniref:N-acetylneuraminate synthase n=1 Tax=Halobacteriovorax marinus TaxID=97084 RepID=A0A1Y5FFG7_9BACT|nr:N-acetylneuraminate synthase [Halobacteriovorax marinus]